MPALHLFIGILVLLGMVPGVALMPEKISLPLGPDMNRADIYIVPIEGNSAGTLILCPGHNGNGQEMIEESAWRNFARKQNLNLVGLSFASDNNPQDRGYFRAETGSGAVLLAGLKRAFGPGLGPLLIFGFSRGAQFTYSFVQWKPDLVQAWCAYSATEWESPESEAPESNGIVACGDEDEPNYSTSAFQFLKGRSMDKIWTWVSLAHTGHSRSSRLEAFVRSYFAAVLLKPKEQGLWLDADSKTPLAPTDLQEHPTLGAWLPDSKSAALWKALHQP